ncbi:LptA/OstA family protein [Candidatus Foliamicus sp.]
MFLAVTLATALPAIQAITQETPENQTSSDLDIKTEWSRYDGTLGRLVSTGVIISQGDFEIQADRAETDSLDFRNSTWLFTGNIRFRAGQATLNCDEAELSFKNKLTGAIIRGNPVSMVNEGKRVVKGSAQTVEYEAESGLIRFIGGAALETSESRVSGESITFDLNAETVTVAPGDGEPVQFLFEFFSSPEDD